MSETRCRCHSNMSLYGTLVRCPRCKHWSLDRGDGWESCERRACQYERQWERSIWEWPDGRKVPAP